MKTYKVVLEGRARADLEDIFEWIYEESPQGAVEWWEGFHEAADSLSTSPKRCSLAPENSFFKSEIRQLLYGKRRQAYRVLFTIEGSTVHILHVRHSARKWLNPGSEE